jgi:hypothetical protein
MPSRRLLLLSFAIIAVALLFVATPLRDLFGFGELPLIYYPIVAVLAISYLAFTQFVKGELIRRKII